MNENAKDWLGLLKNDADFFEENSQHLNVVQEKRLFSILDDNANTLYGSEFNFGNIETYEKFSRQVPIVSYEDIHSYIDQIKQGGKNILCGEPVIRFEKTSGSSGVNKLIPYTNTLINEFQRAVAAWMHAAVENNEDVFNERFYLALSPKLMNEEENQSAVHIGSGDDLGYFDEPTAMSLYPNIVLPDTEKCENDTDFYTKTIETLIQEKLSFISCWSPSYLLEIDSLMRAQSERFKLNEGFVWKDIWPELAVVSCWTDASSGLFISELKNRLGEGIEIEAKGLLSTECICSIPYKKDLDPILSYTSHFYEFEDENGKVYPAGEVQKNKQYSIIITSSGGLYRYKTGDCVTITGFYKSIPAFRFMGREGRVSDLVGEKLSEAQVNEAFQKLSLPPSVLIAVKDHYELASDHPISASVLYDLDEQLKNNCYYQQARKLGQLKDLSFKHLNQESFNSLQMNPGQDSTKKFKSLILHHENSFYLRQISIFT